MAGGYQGDWVFSKIMEDRANSFADKNFLLCQDDSYTYGRGVRPGGAGGVWPGHAGG